MGPRTTTIGNDRVGDRQVDRRSVFIGAAGAAAAGFAARVGTLIPAAAQDASPAAATGGRATFVLVPGQWTGAFVWHKVAPLLRAAGHDVYPVTCTGLGERAHLASASIDLDTFVTDVVNVLEHEDLRDVTLVGHSFGGMIITGVAERAPERLARIVYFDAQTPADGQNSYDADMQSEVDTNKAIAADLAGGMAIGKPGFRPVFPDIVTWLRGAIKDPAEADWFIGKLVPHPELTNLQPVKLGNPKAAALPRAFILCTADKDLNANPQTDPYVLTVQRVRSDPNWRVLEIADTHMANLNVPQAVADALISLV
jgi:pimeloyl-ACP methyl ester carboxylesterase